MSIITPEEFDELDKKYLRYKYAGIYYGINKQGKDMEIKEISIPYQNQCYFEPLIEKNNSDDKNNKNNYFLKYIKEPGKNGIYRYNSNGYNVNKIYINSTAFDTKKYLSLIYSEKVLILFFGKIFKIYTFSDNYYECDSYSLSFQHLLSDSVLSVISYYFDDLLKINPTNILLINNFKGYVITFDEELKNIIQIYDLPEQNIIKADTVYYYNQNKILETGIIIISSNHIDYLNYLSYEKSRRHFKRNLKSFNYDKFEPNLTIYNDRMEKVYDFKFKCNFDKNQIIKIHYNHKNNMILIFTSKSIFQLNLNTKQIITKYNISFFINNPIESSLQSLANKIKILYNYNRTNNKIEEKIFILNDEINQVCLFDWKDKTLVFNNKNIYPNLYDFIAFYPVDILHLLNNKEMFELKILFFELNEKKEEKKK